MNLGAAAERALADLRAADKRAGWRRSVITYAYETRGAGPIGRVFRVICSRSAAGYRWRAAINANMLRDAAGRARHWRSAVAAMAVVERKLGCAP